MSGTLTVKILGQKETVLGFLEVLERIYPLLVKSPVRLNDCEAGVHVFCTIDTRTVNKEVLQ